MSDAAPAIRNGFKAVFGYEKSVLICWFHVRKNNGLKLNLVLNKKFREEIIKDVDLIQLAQSKHNFSEATRLFFIKWKSEKPFLGYLKEEWIDRH